MCNNYIVYYYLIYIYLKQNSTYPDLYFYLSTYSHFKDPCKLLFLFQPSNISLSKFGLRGLNGNNMCQGYQARKQSGHVYVLGVSSQETEQSCICVRGIKPGNVLGVSSQETVQSCICVRGIKPGNRAVMYICQGYQARKQSSHVYVLGVSSQETEWSCICVRGIKPGNRERSCICVRGIKPGNRVVMYMCQGYKARKQSGHVYVRYRDQY